MEQREQNSIQRRDSEKIRRMEEREKQLIYGRKLGTLLNNGCMFMEELYMTEIMSTTLL